MTGLVVIITYYDLLQGLVTLDKSHKIIVAKTICGTKLQWQSHKHATYMNFSSIQTNLHGIVILQLIWWLNDVIALYIYHF
jgi:hypothetical protein